MDGGCIQENCPQGVVNELRSSVIAAHEYTESGTANPQTIADIEAKFDEIEEWLAEDSTSSRGVVDQLGEFKTELDAIWQ